VVDGPARLLGRFTGEGDNLDDLLGAEGGRFAGPGGVIEEVLQEPAELRRGQVPLGGVQGGGRLPPAVAPGADGHAGQSQLAGHRLDAGVVGQGQDDGGPPDPALVSGLLSLNPLQHGLLCRGDLDSGRSWSSHHPAHSENVWTIGPEPILWSPPHSGQVLSPPCTSSTAAEKLPVFLVG
jgi:hypothetical protein